MLSASDTIILAVPFDELGHPFQDRAVGAPLLPALDAVTAGLRADREVAHAVGAAAAPARLVATALTGLGLLGLAVTWWVGGTRPRRSGVATLAR